MSISSTLISSLIFETLVSSKSLVDPTLAIMVLKRLQSALSQPNGPLLQHFTNCIECRDVDSLLLAKGIDIFLRE